MTATKDVGFLKPLESAIALCDSFKSIVIKTADDYSEAEKKRKQARDFKAALLVAYNSHPTVIAAKEIQVQKKALEDRLEEFNKNVKSGPMAKYEAEQERIRQAEERRLAEIARKEQEAETARLVEIQRQEAIKAEAARKAAEVEEKKAEAARKKAEKAGDEEAAHAAAERAEAARQTAQAEADRKEAARQEALAVQADAAAAPAPVVVLERSTPAVSRRKVYRFRLTTKDGRKFLKNEITAATRLQIRDLGPLPADLFVLSPVLLSEFVDSHGETAAIPGVLEVKSEMV